MHGTNQQHATHMCHCNASKVPVGQSHQPLHIDLELYWNLCTAWQDTSRGHNGQEAQSVGPTGVRMQSLGEG